MQESKEYSRTKESLEIEKLRSEIAELQARRQKGILDYEKTDLEVTELKRHWYRKPQYVLAALPTTLALMGIVAGLYSGYFSDKIASLQQDVTRYEKEKKELLDQNKESQQNLLKLDERIQQLNTDKGEAATEVQLIRNEMNGLLEEKRTLDKQVALLNTEQGLNQSQLQRAQGEYARLNTRREELEGKLSALEANLVTADIKSLTDLWLGINTKEEDGDLEENEEARNQIVSLFSQRPMQQKQYISFLETYLLGLKATPEKYISVVSLLLELTKEPKWKKELVALTLGYLQAIKTDQDASISALAKIAERAKNSDEESLEGEIQAVVFAELEKGDLSSSNTGSVLWLFVKSALPPRARLHRSNPSHYLRVIKIAREAAIESDDYEFRDLRRYSQTAFFAVIGYLIQKQKFGAIDKNFRFTRNPTKQMKALEVPTTKSPAEWKSWAEKSRIKRLVELWFEDDFDTFKSNPDLFNRLIEEGEIS